MSHIMRKTFSFAVKRSPASAISKLKYMLSPLDIKIDSDTDAAIAMSGRQCHGDYTERCVSHPATTYGFYGRDHSPGSQPDGRMFDFTNLPGINDPKNTKANIQTNQKIIILALTFSRQSCAEMRRLMPLNA